MINKPFIGEFRISATFQDHLDRDPPSTAPGVDYACPAGTVILATNMGTVTHVHWGSRGGRYIMIHHPDNSRSLYSHLLTPWVAVGERVHRGEMIALSGNSGASTGPHLHYGRKVGGQWVDPETEGLA